MKSTSKHGNTQLQVRVEVRSRICLGVPVVFGGVFEELPQLQRVFTDLLDGREQETGDGNVNHLLEKPAGLKEMFVFPHLHEALQLGAGCRMRITVFGVDRETLSLQKQKNSQSVIVQNL